MEAAGGEPVELLDHLPWRATPEAAKDVDDFGHVGGADRRVSVWIAEQCGDIARGRLVGQQRDDGLGVEKGQDRPQRRTFAAASSLRKVARVASLVGPDPASEPIAAPMGSTGIGRRTMESPRSSTKTRDVPHRRRTSAGTEICPPREMVACFMKKTLSHGETPVNMTGSGAQESGRLWCFPGGVAPGTPNSASGTGEAPLGDGAGAPGSRTGAGHAQGLAASGANRRSTWSQAVRSPRVDPIRTVWCFTNNAPGRGAAPSFRSRPGVTDVSGPAHMTCGAVHAQDLSRAATGGP